MTTRFRSIELPHGMTAETVDVIAGQRLWHRVLSFKPQIRIKRSQPGRAWRLVVVEGASTDLPTTCRISLTMDESGRRLAGTGSVTISGHVVFPAVVGVFTAGLGVLLAGSDEATWWWWLVPIASLVVFLGPAWRQAKNLASDEARLVDCAVKALVAKARKSHPELPEWQPGPAGDGLRYIAVLPG